MKKNIVKRMCFDAIFAAMSIVLYLFVKFPLPALFPGFLEINFSMLPILIATFMLGYIDGIAVAFIRFALKLLFGSHTMCVGETSDLILSLVVILSVFLIDHYFKNDQDIELKEYDHKYIHVKHKGILMYATIIISWVIGGMISNAFCIPMYCFLWTKEAVMSMICVFPWVNQTNWLLYYFTLAIIPFNIIISSIVGIITLGVNKHLKPIYKKI